MRLSLCDDPRKLLDEETDLVRSAQKGDLYVELAVETPVRLTKRQKELLREFEAESQIGTQPEAEGFLARLKDFWKACEK